MNIAAIYDKYDLWGKVKVSRYDNSGAPMFVKNLSTWLIKINDKEYHRFASTNRKMTIGEALRSALESYLECEYCEGTGEVSAPHYTKGGEIPDSDFIKCKSCNGTGERQSEN